MTIQFSCRCRCGITEPWQQRLNTPCHMISIKADKKPRRLKNTFTDLDGFIGNCLKQFVAKAIGP